MKRIECVTDNIPAIEAALKAVNGRAEAFAVTDAAFVASLGKKAERYLIDHCVVESDRTGATAVYNPAGPSARSYGYSASSTKITLSRQAGKWYIADIVKEPVWPREPARFAVKITDKAADNLATRMMKAFGRERSPEDEQMRKQIWESSREIKQLKHDVKYLRGKYEPQETPEAQVAA